MLDIARDWRLVPYYLFLAVVIIFCIFTIKFLLSNKRPAINLFVVNRVDYIVVFKDVAFLLV